MGSTEFKSAISAYELQETQECKDLITKVVNAINN